MLASSSRTWIGTLMAVAHGEERLLRLTAQEERARLDLLVDERSSCASIVRRLLVAQGRAQPLLRVQRTRAPLSNLDDAPDDTDSSGEASQQVDADLLLRREQVASRSVYRSLDEAAGGVELVVRRTTVQYRRVAAQRQLDWSVFESRVRDLRREFDRTGDERLLDAIAALKRPQTPVAPASSWTAAASPQRAAHGASPSRATAVAAAASPGRPSSPASKAGGGGCTMSAAGAAAVDGAAVAQQQHAKEEGFIRSTVMMEEQSCRAVLSRRWATSLTHPDEEMLAHRRTVVANLQELRRRDADREAEAIKAADADMHANVSRFRAIAAVQNHRAQTSKDQREERIALCDAEQRARWLVLQHEHSEFTVGMFERRINSVTFIAKWEETTHRMRIAASEAEVYDGLHTGLTAMTRALRLLLQHHSAAASLFQQHRLAVGRAMDAEAEAAVASGPSPSDGTCASDPDDAFLQQQLATRPEAIASAARLASSVTAADMKYLELLKGGSRDRCSEGNNDRSIAASMT
jgi:hypothetical protein